MFCSRQFFSLSQIEGMSVREDEEINKMREREKKMNVKGRSYEDKAMEIKRKEWSKNDSRNWFLLKIEKKENHK